MFTASLVGADPTAAELSQALQRKYDTVRDFSADFVHTYQGGVLKRKVTESGSLVVKKPGRMRWEYKKPVEKLFISDGVTVYFYVPADRQVVVSDVPADSQVNTPALFLAGKGNLTRDFTVSDTETPAGLASGARTLKLVPRVSQPEYDALLLSVDPGTLVLRGLQWVDAQGGVSGVAFSNVKENIAAADKQFSFTIPRGVDVVTDSVRR